MRTLALLGCLLLAGCATTGSHLEGTGELAPDIPGFTDYCARHPGDCT